MIYEKIINEGHAILVKYNLYGWEIKFDNAKRRFGLCSYRKKTISFSKELVYLNQHQYNKIYETLLHEIGHALSYSRYGSKGRGHGWLWKACVKELGGNPTRCYNHNEVVAPKGKYKYVCSKGHERFFFKKLKGRYSCSVCGEEHNTKGFVEKFLLNFVGVE